MNKQHTETPWQLRESYMGFSICDTGTPERSVGIIQRKYDNAQANAAFIVKAVNAHDDLIEMLEDAREFILRFDESDDEEIEMSKKISAVLEKVKAQ